jgi:carboxyl-terminal processing protease
MKQLIKCADPVGSEIIITVVREGVDEPFDVSIIRDTIEIKAVKARSEGKTVVLRVSSFTSKTYPNLKESLEKEINAAGGLEYINGVVVDLRNNPGGLLNQAIRVSDAFLESGEIVSTRGRGARDAERYNATPGDLTNGKPIVVLINGGSASASEIVAGALQDHHRAIIVGTKSFGKGSVQTIIPLSSDGAAMRLTTARYYTPSGRSIQSLGVSPDILVEQRIRSDEDPDEARNFQRFEADLENSLSNDSLTDDERKFLEDERKKQEETAKMRNDDYQLSYALDVLKGLATLSQ